MIKKILMKLLKKDIEAITATAFKEGKVSQRMEERQNRANFARVIASDMIGKPVIILVNEWSNPVVGELIDVHFKDDESPYPLHEVYNYITGENTCSLSTPMAFSVQKLHALGKMSPDEIVALFYEGRNHFHTYRKHPTYGKNKDEIENFYSGFDDWMEKITKNGFFDKFGDFLHDQEAEAETNWTEKELAYTQ